MSLKQKALSGVIWSAAERFSVQGIQFILSFVIARQLLPSDYGLIAMLTIFMAIAQAFIDSGFSNALIQKQSCSQTDYSTVFYFNIIIGLLVYIILVLFSPLIASFYDQPILKTIIAWVGLNLIVSSFSTVQRAILTIELKFKKQAVIALISVIISGSIAVYMAYRGCGVWTLVAQGLINGFVNVFLLWVTTKWMPSLEFSFKSFRQLFTFGSKILASGLLHTLYVNLYTLVIGKVYPVYELGLYNRAYSTACYPSQNVVGLLNKVVYPVMCKFQNDDTTLSEKFTLFVRLTVFFVFPMMIGLASLSEPIIHLTLTEKWLGCVPYIQILCVAYMWDPIMNFSCGLINSRGRSDYYLKAELIKKIAAAVILCVTIPMGLKIMCAGLVVYSFVDMIIITRYTKKIIPSINLKNLLVIVFPILCQSILMGVIVYSVNLFLFENLYLKIFGGLIVGVISYFMLSLIFSKSTLKELFSLISINRK